VGKGIVSFGVWQGEHDSAALATEGNVTVIRFIEKMVVEAPDRTALGDASSGVSYGQLWERSADLAQTLRSRGISPGDFVGLCVERSPELVIGALAIMRAGGVYVAIDPAYPDERINWMLKDSGAAAVLTDAANAARLSGPPVVRVDMAETAATGGPLPSPSVSDLAYVVYTSGSTGTPKGVLVGHDNLVNLIEWHRAQFGLTAADRCTQVASPGFDAAVWEIWPALAAGATLLIVPEHLRTDPGALRDWLIAEGITVSFLPTAVAEGVIRMNWPATATLRHLLTGGDALSVRPTAGLPFEVVNNYGLSETTVVATSGTVDPEGPGAPSIGRAIRSVELHVVGEDLAPVAAGAEGELVIGGAAVARGYLGRPELTAERFLDGESGLRYRTGDRVRLTPAGEVEFLGRVDDQLSIRGFRVEPGEVVAALTAHPAVAAAVVAAAGQTSAERRLVAYLVADGTEPPSAEQLDRRLGESLPAYMVPAHYVWLAELPLNAHGKVDREELARLGVLDDTIPAGAPGGAGTAAEIAAIVAELLGVATVAPDQNFFLLGGHSMLGAQLIVRIGDRFGAEIGLRFLFDHPTAAELAGEVDAQREADVHNLVTP
jgi:amino acid adenylation domain-containing protein